MDLIRDNVNTLRNSVQREDYTDTTVVDVLTAIYIILGKRIDYAIMDDKYFLFLLGCIRNVPVGEERIYWFNTIFTTYEKITNVDTNDSSWLLLKANLVYLAPRC